MSNVEESRSKLRRVSDLCGRHINITSSIFSKQLAQLKVDFSEYI